MSDRDRIELPDRLDLDWLAAQRPAPGALDAGATDRARAELLAHIEARPPAPARTLGRAVARAIGRAEPGTRRRARLAVAAMLVVGSVGAAIVAVIVPGAPRAEHHPVEQYPVAGPTGAGQRGPAKRGGDSGAGAPTARHAVRLEHLTTKLLAAPAPAGDATLVIRRQVYPNAPEIDGADLYEDDGDYYYATEPSGLPAVMRAHETVNEGDTDGEVRDIAAAKAAFDGPIDAARHRMAIAELDPNAKPASELEPRTAAEAQILRHLKRKIAEIRAKAGNPPPASPEVIENGEIWDNSMDALLAGAGDPQVRAGVLHLLATVSQISVTQGTIDGQPGITLSAALWAPGDYTESLTINADTGIPIEFVGGDPGSTPSVTVTYRISRVEAAAVEDGSFAPAVARARG